VTPLIPELLTPVLPLTHIRTHIRTSTHHTPSADPGQTFDNVTLRSWIAAYKFGLNIKHTQM